MDCKQVLVMRKDLGMSPGKLAAQAAHASLLAYDVAPYEYIGEWKRNGITKVVLSGESEEQILSLYKAANAAYLPVAIVCDEGRTEVKPGTFTGIAIGPAPRDEVDKITGTLQLY